MEAIFSKRPNGTGVLPTFVRVSKDNTVEMIHRCPVPRFETSVGISLEPRAPANEMSGPSSE
ncbi:hypothetical protein PGTUg99_023868 [Puccinia graminis f. sp. tritici]|uniref:Uncharacterized protein n=1 Tax=Puccinia graminis f. sp. tritici TaxID=56615 RepID=A0A5B0N217_PUCGR|nr:hypothetical protein PGTUg99_023868 [Puccinia graminis f. sp. tritici]